MKFSLYDQEDNNLVEGAKNFQYLVRALQHTENDWPEVHWNIGRARSVWRRLVKYF